jgi:hypothetical protein
LLTGIGTYGTGHLADFDNAPDDAERSRLTLLSITRELGYSQQQLQALVDEVRAAYEGDDGKSLIHAAFASDTAVEAASNVDS